MKINTAKSGESFQASKSLQRESWRNFEQPNNTCLVRSSKELAIWHLSFGHTHNAKLVGADCERFILWATNPKAQDRRVSFYGVQQQKKLSPRQGEVLARIEGKMGGGVE